MSSAPRDEPCRDNGLICIRSKNPEVAARKGRASVTEINRWAGGGAAVRGIARRGRTTGAPKIIRIYLNAFGRPAYDLGRATAA